MKKVILAAAILLTTGIISTNIKSAKVAKTAVVVEKDILATAD